MMDNELLHNKEAESQSSRSSFYAAFSAGSTVCGLVINIFIIYSLLKIPPRFRLARSEKYFMLSMAVCGLGSVLCISLPTFIVTTFFSEYYPDLRYTETTIWCQAIGIMGIIFMTASSWFSGLLAINRSIIIASVFKRDVAFSKRCLIAIQAVVWLIVTLMYVIMCIMVESGIDVPELSKESKNFKNVSNKLLVTDYEAKTVLKQFNFKDMYLTRFFTAIFTSETDNKISFLVFDCSNAIICGPNWRMIPRYFYAALTAFFIIPLICTTVSYAVITRIAFQQIKKIKRIRICPSVGATESEQQENLGPGFIQLHSLNRDYWIKHATLAVGLIGLPNPEGKSVNSQPNQATSNQNRSARSGSHFGNIKKFKTSCGRRKATFSLFIVFFIFISTWTPYIAYFIIEINTCFDYMTSSLPFNDSFTCVLHDSRISSNTSYLMTWSALEGRTWSVVMFALLNRKLRCFIKRQLISLYISFLNRIKKCCGMKSNKVAPVFLYTSSNRNVFDASQFLSVHSNTTIDRWTVTAA